MQSSMRNAHGRTNATCGRLVSHQSAATDTQTSYYGHSLPRGSPFIAPRQPFTIQPLQESFHARSPKSSKQHIISASRSVPILFTASSRKQTIQHIFLFIQNQNCSSHMQGNFHCNLYSGDQTSTFKAGFAATASKMQLCFFFLCDFRSGAEKSNRNGANGRSYENRQASELIGAFKASTVPFPTITKAVLLAANLITTTMSCSFFQLISCRTEY